MLFNRLAEGEIDLPEFPNQIIASESLKVLKNIKLNIEKEMENLNVIPNKLLAVELKL